MRIDFRPAPVQDQLEHFTQLLDRIPGQGRVSDLLEIYRTDKVIFTFRPPVETLPLEGSN